MSLDELHKWDADEEITDFIGDDEFDDEEDFYNEDLDNESLDAHVDDAVKQYLKNIGRYPLLNADEEIDLSQRIHKGIEARKKLDSGKVTDKVKINNYENEIIDGEAAKDTLTKSNTRLVVSIAKRYWSRSLPLLDIIQEGNIGLMRAVVKYDHSRGFRFSTYATWWIRQAITRGLADKDRPIRVPVHMNDRINSMVRLSGEIEKTTGKKPTNKELADILETTPEKVEAMWRYNNPTIDLDMPVGDDDSTFGDFIAGNEISPAAATNQTILEETITEILGELQPRQAFILRLRFGLEGNLPHTLEEIANKFGLSRERIRQIEKEALRKLHHPRIAHQLRDYLNPDEL